MNEVCDVTLNKIRGMGGWMDGTLLDGSWMELEQIRVHSGQTAGWSPQMLVKSKGISKKNPEQIRFRNYYSQFAQVYVQNVI